MFREALPPLASGPRSLRDAASARERGPVRDPARALTAADPRLRRRARRGRPGVLVVQRAAGSGRLAFPAAVPRVV